MPISCIAFGNKVFYTFYIQWNLCNLTPEFSDILWHPTKIYGSKVFLLTKIKLSIPTSCTIRHISLVPWCVELDRFHCTYLPITNIIPNQCIVQYHWIICAYVTIQTAKKRKESTGFVLLALRSKLKAILIIFYVRLYPIIILIRSNIFYCYI